jgi:hypothetical protein
MLCSDSGRGRSVVHSFTDHSVNKSMPSAGGCCESGRCGCVACLEPRSAQQCTQQRAQGRVRGEDLDEVDSSSCGTYQRVNLGTWRVCCSHGGGGVRLGH